MIEPMGALSVCMMASRDPARVRAILVLVRPLADEIVLAVDGRSRREGSRRIRAAMNLPHMPVPTHKLLTDIQRTQQREIEVLARPEPKGRLAVACLELECRACPLQRRRRCARRLLRPRRPPARV